MTQAEEILATPITDSAIDRATAFLESCAFTTEALGALAWAIEQMGSHPQGKYLRGCMTGLAAIEAEEA